MEHRLTDADVPCTRYRQPSVRVRPEGSDGYYVAMTDVDGTPTDLRYFPIGESDYGKRADRERASAQARAYRDGVAEGIFQASHMLNRIIGAGT